ncbi:LAQU0S02e06656g1_1 [Lachancea quebecensis]|uniref:LAQU0S02e06656g1_1 n=1 Tax=Lachancea quebecensis TaxID=1654605 RepID=A0A0P1KMU2_9SACH|nr:LAQU0S02e06656g1_1 [Lachancea quebecensis]
MNPLSALWTLLLLAPAARAATITLASDPAPVWTTTRTTVFRTVRLSAASVTRASSLLSVTTATTAPSATSLSFQTQVLLEHNSYRALHRAPELAWSTQLAAYAQNYANSYNCNGTLVHSSGPYGENLALGYNSSAAVAAWYNEVRLYDFKSPGFAEDTGHFSQLVWVSSKRLGCARVDCGDYYGQYTICNYDPPGNVAGQYKANVLKT